MKIIFIDWNLTLSKSRFWEPLQKTDNTLFISLEECLFQKNKDLIIPWMKGEKTSKQICKVVSTQLKISPSFVYKEFVNSCKKMIFQSKNFRKYIKRIRNKGIKVYIATDNMDSFTKWTSPSMKLKDLFDGIINSNKVGFLKKDFDKNGNSLFFENVLKKQKIAISEAVLIDDNKDLVDTFSNYGFKCFHIHGKNSLDKILINLLAQKV